MSDLTDIQTKYWHHQTPDADAVEKALQEAYDLGAEVEREACAALCEELVTHPVGYLGQWEGYGPVQTQRNGKSCADAIRRRTEAM